MSKNKKAITTSEYLSTKEAANLLGCTPKHIQQRCLDGDIPEAIKKGRSWLIPSTQPSRIKSLRAAKTITAVRVRQYVLAHLGEACKEYSDLIEEIQEDRIHPSRANYNAPKRIKEILQPLIVEQISYIEQLVKDLRELK